MMYIMQTLMVWIKYSNGLSWQNINLGRNKKGRQKKLNLTVDMFQNLCPSALIGDKKVDFLIIFMYISLERTCSQNFTIQRNGFNKKIFQDTLNIF